MNALQYMKNVGKSLGYATIDVVKSNNPSVVAFASSAKDLGSDLYQSIRDFKETPSGARSELSLRGQIKNSVKDIKKSIFADLKTGNWYNQQRIKQVDNEMMSDMFGGDFSFDFDDDFGDFEFEDDDSGTSSVVKQQISNEQQSTKTIVSSMDIVGSKMAGAISTASVKSADYIVTAQRESSKAMYAITNRGFNQVATGLAAVNASINNLVQLGQPLSAHMQNSTVFYGKSTEYQQESIKLLRQLVENTAPKSANGEARKGAKYTIDDILSGGSIDFGAYASMLKDSVKDMTSMVSSLIEMSGGVKGIGKSMTKSPLSGLLTMGINAIMPKALKEAQQQFNDQFENFFAAGIEKLRDKSFNGPLGGLFDLFKDKLLPSSGYKGKLDVSKYNKGRVDWDGMSRKALMEVIPFQLSQIVSALTGQPQKIFNYNSGKWQTIKSVQKDFNDQKKKAANNAGGDYIYGAKETARNLSAKNKISAKEKDQIIKEIEAYNTYAFHSDNSEFMNLDDDNFNYKKFGMSKQTWEFMRQYNKTSSNSNRKANRMNYAGNVARERSRYGRTMRQQEADGTNISNVLFNDSIDEKAKNRTLLGVDEYNNDMFFYLQGIYLATTHVSDNLGVLAGGKRLKGTAVQKNGKTAPIRTLTARASESDRSEANERISPSATTISAINAADIDSEARGALDARDMNHLPDELQRYVAAKQAAEESGGEIEGYDSEQQKELEKQLAAFGGYDKFVQKMKRAARANPIIAKVGNALGKLVGVPSQALADLINSAQVSMERVIFGSGSSQGEKGLSETLSDGFKSLFDGVKEKIDDLLPPGVKEGMGNLFETIFGKKGEDGTRSGGIGSGLFNATVGELKNAGKWVKGAFTGNAANGRKITKTGLVAVSEGEMIIPAEYNPFYKKKINKRSQIRNEMTSIRNFYGNFYDGKDVVGDDVETDENGNIKGGAKGTGKAEKMGGAFGATAGFFGQGAKALGNGFMALLKGLIPDGKDAEKEKSNISKVASAALEDIGDSKGAAAAGAIIGGGVSLLTGALVGPILGAGIGAATGLIIRSDKVKNVLFGEEDENGDRTGGVLSKNISNFMMKNIPGMAKGATVGGAAGLFMGSPVLGAILGSAVGYVSSSDRAKNTLFGEKDEEGNRQGGIISKDLQKAIKDRMPGMGAGAIAGLVAGPFGLAGNLVVGSALGYAASSDKFKTWMFGEEDTDGKRKGGFIGLIKDNLITPLVGIFDKVGEEIKVHVRNTFANVGKSIRTFILKNLGGKVKDKTKKTIGNLLSKLPGGAVGGVGGILKGANNALQNRALKKGYSIKDRTLGRNMTAEEREALGGNMGKFGDINAALAAVQSEEELSDFQTAISSLIDPTKKYDNDIIKSRGTSKRLLQEYAGNAQGKEVYALIKAKKFAEAREKLNATSMDAANKEKISKEIDKQEEAWKGRELAKSNAHEAKNQILQNSKWKEILGKDSLTDNDLRAIMDLTKDEKSRFKEGKDAKTPENALTYTIPDLLTDIIKIMAGDEAAREKWNKAGGFQSEAASNTAQDAINEQNRSNSNFIGPMSAPKNGDTKYDDEAKKMIYTNGGWEYDTTDNETRQAIDKKNKVMDALIGLPLIGNGIGKLVDGFGSLKEKLFGKGDEEGKNKGFFTKILEGLTGEDGVLGGMVNFFTGGKLAGVLSKFSLKAALPTLGGILGVALFGAAAAGKFDDFFSKFGWGKSDEKSDTETATLKDGTTVTLNKETGKYEDAEGNSYDANQVDSSSIRVAGGDTASFSERLNYNTARGVLTNTRSVASTALGKTKIGKSVASVASNVSKIASGGVDDAVKIAAKNNLCDMIIDGCTKFTGALRKIPVLSKIADKLDDMGLELAEKATKAAASEGAEKIARMASNAVVFAKIAFVAVDFTTGYEDAATTLKVKDPTTGQKIIAGLLRAVKNFIPVIGSLIPDDMIVDVFVKYVAPIFGMDIDEFNQERANAQAEVDAYNAEHGTDMDWQEYNKTVRKDYTWTERIGNAAKSTGASIKQKFSNMKEGISEKGLGGYLKDSVSTMANTFTESYKKNGGGPGGALNALGDTMKGILPGVLGDIAKANMDIRAFATKGDIKGVWGVSLPDFSNDGSDPNQAQVGIFSKIIGQIPLIVNKVASTPIAAISWAGHKVMEALSPVIDTVKTTFTDVSTTNDAINKAALSGDIKGMWAIEPTVSEDNPIGGFVKVISTINKIGTTPFAAVSWVGHKIFDGIKAAISGIKASIEFIQDQKSIGANYLTDKDSSLKDFLNVEGVPESPLSGVVKAIAIGARISVIPSLLVKKAGKFIWEKFTAIKDKVVTSVRDIATNYADKFNTSKTGDMNALWSSEEQVDEENPIGGIMGGIGFMQKLMLTPSTAIHWAGNKLKEGFDFVKGKVVSAASNIAQEYIEKQDLAKSGDITGLWQDKTEVDPENPIGGIMGGIGFMQKLMLTPTAAFHWAGKKIMGGITTIVDNTKSNFTTMTDGMDTLKDLATEGNLSEIWKTKIELKTPGPLNGITTGIFNISKFFYSIIAIIEKISGPIKGAIEKVTGWVGDAKDFVGDKVEDVKEFGGKVKDTVSGAAEKAGDWIGDKANVAYDAVTNFFGGRSGLSAGSSGFVSQIDPRYANKGIGNSTVGQLGCGPATAVMALKQAGKSASMNNAISAANSYQTGTGTDAAYFGDYFRRNGANASYYDGSAAGKSNIINSIQSGRPTILMGQDPYNRSKANSPFGPNNHYVVASGMDSRGNIIVNDPESNRGGIKYNPGILNSVKMGVGVSGAGSYLRRRFGLSAGAATAYPHNTRVDATTKAIWAFFRGKGYSEAATAGIMGNLQQESGIDPTRLQGGGGPAKGICQWEGGRFTAMAQYAASKGKDWTDLSSQLEYMDQEVQGLDYWFKRNANTTVQGFMTMTDVVTATAAFEKAFERAGKPAMENRYKYAKYYYEQFTGKTYNYDPAVGAAMAGTSSSFIGADSSTGSTGSSVASAVKGFGLLSTISSAFGKIGDLFNGSSSDSSTGSTGGADSSYSGSAIDASSGENANPNGVSFSGNTPLDLLKSIQGKISYSMEGPRNPEKGSADCSSTVQWAIKKAGGPDIGGSTPAQYNNANLKTVWYGNGNVASSLPSNIKPNDVLFFSRPNSGYTAGRQDRVGHVELYAGDGQMIGHGGGMGPKLKQVPLGMGTNGGLIKVARAAAGGSGLLDLNNSASGSRLLLLNDSNRNSNPFVNNGRLVYSNGYRGGRLSAGESALGLTNVTGNAALANAKSGITKDTAALLKVIITLIESLVSNTSKIDNIYDVLAKYCEATLGARGATAAAAVSSLQQQSSSNSNSDIENSLSSLKATVDSILAS